MSSEFRSFQGATEERSAENLERMRRGRAPHRENPNTGELESKELHHAPISQREGGKEFIAVWPDEHARLDPYRKLER